MIASSAIRPAGIVDPHHVVVFDRIAPGVEHRPGLVEEVRREDEFRLEVRVLLPIDGNGELSGDDDVHEPRVGVFLGQLAVGIVRLAVLVGEEIGFTFHEQGAFFQCRVGQSIGGVGVFFRRVVVFLLPIESVALAVIEPGDALIGSPADRRFERLGEVVEVESRPAGGRFRTRLTDRQRGDGHRRFVGDRVPGPSPGKRRLTGSRVAAKPRAAAADERPARRDHEIN